MSNQLYLGDCLEIMKGLADASIDAVITDPPWGLGFDYGDTYIDTIENLKGLIEKLLPEMARVSERQIISSAILTMFCYPQPNWVSVCTWNTTGSYGKYGVNQYFPMLCYGKDIKGFGSINGLIKGDVLKINGGGSVGFRRNDQEKNHPCPKPLGLVEMMIRRWSNEGDTILDPFMGSGTTGVACVKLNRNFIGIEINPQYFEIAQRRIQEAQAQLTMQLAAA